jgi:hypothetical protein
MTRDAIPLSVRLGVAAQTSLIVEGVVTPAGVDMRDVTGGALELVGGVALTHGETKRLEADVLGDVLSPRYSETMTGATEFDLSMGA